MYVNAEWRLVVELFEIEPGFSFAIGRREAVPPTMDSWDTTYQHAGPRLWPHETSLPPFARDWLETIAPTAVLDLGCGDGKNLKWLVERGRHHVIGVDGSQTALAQCRQHMAGADPRSFELLSMDVPSIAQACWLASCARQSASTCSAISPTPSARSSSCITCCTKAASRWSACSTSTTTCDRSARLRCSTSAARDYYYYPQGDAARRQFFRFYREGAPEALLARTGFVVKRCGLHRWREPAPPCYRDHAHTHTSWFLLVEKPA